MTDDEADEEMDCRAAAMEDAEKRVGAWGELEEGRGELRKSEAVDGDMSELKVTEEYRGFGWARREAADRDEAEVDVEDNDEGEGDGVDKGGKGEADALLVDETVVRDD